ncbi:ArsA family ATPase [Streptomyces qinzhouensis]|uniref:ArsA family ATPase n=1 Tax=Streptomyces qinzhouensis TaxID=2599401 RepID=A0A5B8J3P0_9ACTN|nr:ArsA-related P-loop ATPase [Streptomyces qinzhouensis]QDY76365.1 ArsA family ATPase [Streptomyces qinzhouensis]
MRTVLVTGLGGAGRTTVAAATALAAARGGRRTLLLSPEPGEALAAVLGLDAPPSATPSEAAPGLRVARIDAGTDFRDEFLAFQERAGAALELLGAAPLAGEELTELPGSAPFALLRAVARHTGGAADHDLVVVDLPPLAETVALLALPGQLRRYLRRLLPQERQAARALRPVLAQLAGVPMPAQWLYDTAAGWDRELAAVEALLTAPGTGLLLVAEPSPAATDALRAARPGLALHGLRVGALVANRLLPAHSADPWLAGLTAEQTKCLDDWGDWDEWGAVCRVAHLGREPRGADDLIRLALPEPADADSAAPRPGPSDEGVEDRRAEDGILTWTIALPGATKDRLGLVRRGRELVLTVGPFRRIVPLPSVLRRCTVTGAALADGVLTVRFTPDPGLWPERD